MKEEYADIIVDISHKALDRPFQYKIPEHLNGQLAPGDRVRVPFGSSDRKTEGFVIAVTRKPGYDPGKIKEILEIIPESISVDAQLIQVADFMRRQYGSTMIQALKMVLPVKRKIRKKTRVSSSEDKAIGADSLPAGDVSGFSIAPLQLNSRQLKIAEDFSREYGEGIRKTYLLFGVTGSGKTEVYLSLIETVLSAGKQAIVLIPEISLTYQTVSRFSARFGKDIAVIHSRMSAGERSDEVERIRSGKARVVIGARSALFAPVRNLGIIIIDEEHDGAYKSDASPKYHARETAIYRAGLAGASVVLGSATPSVESYAKAKAGEYGLWTLTKRAGSGKLPVIRVTDLREEFASGNRSVFGEELRSLIADRLSKKEQIMLFINRRGYAGFVTCRSCGNVVKCPHCDISLTYHRNGALQCHYCGFQVPYDRVCHVCQKPHVAAFGLGTEKAEAALYQEFPGARILRMDADTTRRKHAHEKILKTFAKGDADILLGTQMIVKGHDYANVTLVGILAADLSLNSSDFRSSEKTFQLLCQAAGRAGRGDKPGEVVIQTYSPDHYAISSAVNHSYQEFFEQEYAYRKLMGYPPCAHFLVILIQSPDEKQALIAARRIQQMIRQSQSRPGDIPVILNPGKAAVSKIKDIYRQVLYLKHQNGAILQDIRMRLEPVLLKHPLFAGIQVQFDYDPMNRY